MIFSSPLRRQLSWLLVVALLFAVSVLPAVAQGAPGSDTITTPPKFELNEPVDRIFVLICAFFVFIMQAGFCLLELGLSRAKNCINVVMKNMLDFSLAGISFLFGFVFMFGPTFEGWIGFDFWNYVITTPGDSDLWTFWVFQMMFVGTASTIAAGAMAERTRFVGYLFYTMILSGLIYPILGHWAWGSLGGPVGFGGDQGWLEERGFHDFAGASVVHCVGGAAALAGVFVLGPRIGRFTHNGEPRLIVGHNLPLAALGTFLLWFGWYGYNAGSMGSAGPGLGRIVVNTTMAASVAALTAMISRWIIDGRPDVMIALTGALAGLVSITAGCDVVSPISALAIGAVAGIVANIGQIVLEKLCIDDVVGAVPVHLFGGIWGTVAVGLFHERGFDYNFLITQALGSISMAIGAFALACGTFKLIDLTVGLRATDLEQEDGLDFSEHASNAYPDFVTTDQN